VNFAVQNLDDMSKAQAEEVLSLLGKINDKRKFNKLDSEFSKRFDYARPMSPENIGVYEWQEKFHNAGSENVERCLIAANRVGKTRSGAAETAVHATGLYPDWWEGHRCSKGIGIWVGSDTNETSREIVQLELLGSPIGTGWIPRDLIKGVTYRQAGIPEVVDTVTIKHVSGTESRIVFKTYEQGRKKWQGTSLGLVWLDEEPPGEIFTEAMTRLIDQKGVMMMTFTPLNGMGAVVQHFVDGGDGIFMIVATWEDVYHLDEAEKKRLKASYPEHERDTRTMGAVMAGSGLVYRTPDEDIMCDPFEIPRHWPRLCGIDFGIDHPFAAVWIAWDRDADVVYVYDCYQARGQTFTYHAEAIRRRGEWIPVTWPHDGMQREKSSGKTMALQMEEHGVNMLGISARYDNDKGGGQAVEPIVMEIDERMRTGGFRVFSNLNDWFREKRMYHRKDGKIVPKKDDILSATHYAVMMRRFADIFRTDHVRPDVSTDYNPFDVLKEKTNG